MLALLKFFAVTLSSAASLCFPDGIPELKRVNLTNFAGESFELGIWVPQWAAAVSTSAVMEVLVNERLGIRTVKGGGSATVDGFFAMAGCEQPTVIDDRKCGRKKTDFHIHLEGWTAGYTTIWEKIQLDYPETAPQNLGTMGYFGVSGPYVSKEVIESAYNKEGLGLEFYRSHNSSWYNPAQYFDDISAFNASESLKRCNETRLMDSKAMSDYLRVTNDWDGVDNSSGQVLGKCFSEYFWFAPACRATPMQCYPWISGGPGWGYEHWMQKAAMYSIPTALAVGKAWGDYTKLPTQVKSSFYWWQPDPTFLSLKASPILMPAANRKDQRRGILLTSDEDVPIEKYASFDLHVVAPKAYELLKAFQIDMNVVNELMEDELETGDSPEVVACRWLHNNKGLWSAWMPDPTDCSEQFGLYNKSTQSFVDSREDRTGLSCRACDSGFYSSRIKDDEGYTYVCRPCAAGMAQPSGASLQCTPCSTGEYQDKTASTSCKRCSQGKYQDETGKSECKECPAATTTLGLGSTSVLECGCEAGSINIGNENEEAQCTLCGPGLSCPFSSSMRALKTGQAPLGEKYQTALLTGFYSTLDEPLAVYKCQKDSFCPGGIPEECAGGRQGMVCASCPQGQTSVDDGCVDCNAVTVGLWWILVLLLLIGCSGTYYVLNPKVHAIASAGQSLAASCSLGYALLQTVAILGLMTVEWPDSASGTMSWTKVLLLDLDAMSFTCFASGRPLSRYLLKVFAFPAIFAWMLVSHCLSKSLPDRWKWSKTKTANTIGYILQVGFSIMATVALEGMTCYAHPNGSYSLVKFSGVICGGGEQTAMMVAGWFLLVIFAIGFLVVIVYATYAIPSWSARNWSRRVQCFNFLTNRFRLDKWWFGIPLILRGPLMSLVVTCATDFPAVQVCLNSLILAMYFAIQTATRPWKSPMLNWMDTFASILLLQIITVAGFGAQNASKEVFLTVWSAVVLVLLAVGIVVMVFCMSFAIVKEWCTHQEAKDSALLAMFETRSAGLADQLTAAARALTTSDLPLQQRLDGMNNYDLSNLAMTLDLIHAELLLQSEPKHRRIQSRSVTDRTSIQSTLFPFQVDEPQTVDEKSVSDEASISVGDLEDSRLNEPPRCSSSETPFEEGRSFSEIAFEESQMVSEML